MNLYEIYIVIFVRFGFFVVVTIVMPRGICKRSCHTLKAQGTLAEASFQCVLLLRMFLNSSHFRDIDPMHLNSSAEIGPHGIFGIWYTSLNHDFIVEQHSHCSFLLFPDVKMFLSLTVFEHAAEFSGVL